jgi:hypothetical protein
MAAQNIYALPTRPLPNPQSLIDAVREVIDSNRADYYNPKIFAGKTQHGLAPNLLAVCNNLIDSPGTIEWLEKAVENHPTLLTLEDLVCRHGSRWGFNATTIQNACARSAYFDTIAGHIRYS